MRIFVTGGTGLVGTRLIKHLLDRGDQVILLSRRADVVREKFSGCGIVQGDPTTPGTWQAAVDGCDAVVNLAGRNVFDKRWNAAFKQELVESRVKSTQNVVEALRRKAQRADGAPKVLVNASAIGWYGPHGDEELAEESPPGNDFLAELCVQWEKAAHAVETAGVRCVIVRVGVVLDKEGGALAKLLLPFKLGAGGPVGSGRQWMSWIHHDDLVGLFLLGLDNAAARGPLNGTAPEPVTNREFGKALGAALHRPSFMPTPAFALRLVLGEVADVITAGQRVLPKRPLGLGYSYKFPTVDAALKNIVD
jgi:uncharacterized protein (TIGR01777 family)